VGRLRIPGLRTARLMTPQVFLLGEKTWYTACLATTPALRSARSGQKAARIFHRSLSFTIFFGVFKSLSALQLRKDRERIATPFYPSSRLGRSFKSLRPLKLEPRLVRIGPLPAWAAWTGDFARSFESFFATRLLRQTGHGQAGHLTRSSFDGSRTERKDIRPTFEFEQCQL
jgi:hypothetical protein